VEAGGRTQFFFDAQQLVVLGDAVGPTRGACFYLPGCGSHGEIGDEGILGFSRAVRNDGVVARLAGHLDGVNRFADAADLIQLDENGIGDAFVDAAREPRGVRVEEVVTNQLNFILGCFPAFRLRL